MPPQTTENSAAAKSPRDDAIDVLRGTRDGDDLSPFDLSLLQAVVNANSLDDLRESARQRWQAVVVAVRAGTYTPPWFHGIEHLTKDHEGYVMWRGKTVEHYSFSADRRDDEKAAAAYLAASCLRLERDGITPRTNSLFALWDRMRLGTEMGSTPRYIAVWNSSASSIDLRIKPLISETDEALAQEIEQAAAELGVDNTGKKIQRVLLTQEDFDDVSKSITSTTDYCKRMAWSHGESIIQGQGLGAEPQASLDVLASMISRADLPSKARVDSVYLGMAPQGATEALHERAR